MANGESQDKQNNRRRRGRGGQQVSIQVGRELSSTLLDGFGVVFGGVLRITDKTLEDHSTQGYTHYTEMMRKDSQLAMCFRQRGQTATAQGWNINPGPDDPDDDKGLQNFIQDVFDDIRHFEVSRKRMFHAIAYGFQPQEIMFKLRPDGKIGIEQFKTRDVQRFRFGEDGTLMLTGRLGTGGTPMPAANFLVNTWGSDETPYGEGLLRELYPMWFFKNNGIKQFVRFIEKFGTPYLWANYPRGTAKPEQDALMEVLKAMHGNAAGIGPDGTDFSMTEANYSGVVDVFRFLIEEYADRQYAKTILGQTLSTEAESGTHALAKYHSKQQQHICEEDAQWQEEQYNEVISTLIDVNFGVQERGMYPVFRIPYEEEKDMQAYLTGVSTMVNELGLPVGENWLREQVGVPAPDDDDLALTGRKMPAVSFPGMDVGDSEIDSVNGQEKADGL